MMFFRLLPVLWILLLISTVCQALPDDASSKKRLAVVSSYHPEYAWSMETHQGFCATLLELGYFDNREQIETFSKSHEVETSRAVFKKLWMNTKRMKSKEEQSQKAFEIVGQIKVFKPDLIFLGDDNAAKYVGSQFFGTDIPIVFWGVNNTPVKYGLVDNSEKPGHNVTGIYQPGYFLESLNFLKAVVPQVKTFAVLSDGTTSGRNHVKIIEHHSRAGHLPLVLKDVVSTNDFALWKKQVLALQDSVDAFFIAQYSGLIDDGRYVPGEEVAQWYVSNVKIPEAVGQGMFVKMGMLCGADDSGFNQAKEAVLMAHDILANGADPATYPSRTPERGPLMVNLERAGMLGVHLTEEMGVEVFIDHFPWTTETAKKKLLVVSSYHPQYQWSQDTHKGLCQALLKLGYLEDEEQIDEFIVHNYVESSSVILKKLWMDTKRKSKKDEMVGASLNVYKIAKEFEPDLIFLGDDNAARYVGGHLLDTDVPVVFWGLNNTPLKYGLVDNMEKPGHNVTGVYQSGHYTESLQLLKKIRPDLKTFAVLSSDKPTGRMHYKAIEHLARKEKLPLELVETVATNDFETWKSRALELQDKVDAFFLPHCSGMTDRNGNYVTSEAVVQWYLKNIKIPEAVSLRQYVQQGLLCGTDDSGYNQGYEAAFMAHEILQNRIAPAEFAPRTPKRGLLVVNKTRAKSLGIVLDDTMGIEAYDD